jgi:hypothetical protein
MVANLAIGEGTKILPAGGDGRVGNNGVDMDFEKLSTNKWYKNTYKYVMPILAILCYGFFPSLIHRKLIFGNIISDGLLRIAICIWFSALYIQISDIQNYSIFPNIRWKKKDVNPSEKRMIIFGYILFSIGYGLMTWWIIRFFYPAYVIMSYLFAISNAIIIAIPLISQYQVFKL